MIAACKFCGELLDGGRLLVLDPEERRAAEFTDLAEVARGHIGARHPELAHALSAVLLLPGRYLSTLILTDAEEIDQRRAAMKAELLAVLSSCTVAQRVVTPGTSADDGCRLVLDRRVLG